MIFRAKNHEGSDSIHEIRTGTLMSLIFEPVHTAGIAQLSSLVGDDSKGVACVRDPRRDVDSSVSSRER